MSAPSETSPTRKKWLAELELIRRRALSDLYYFDKYVLGYNLMEEHVHRPFCHFLQKEIERAIGDQITRLVLMPRNSFKSVAGTVGLSLWRLARDPDTTILITNEKLDKSKGFLKEIKGHISDNDKFKTLFGEWSCENRAGKKWSETRIDIATRTKGGAAPSIEASSVESSETGKHVDLLICDDLVGKSNFQTPEQLDKVIDYYKDLGSVLKPGGEMIIIGTRWDYRDLYQYVMDVEKQLGDSASIIKYIKSAHREDGSLFFPEILTEQFLAEKRVIQGAYFYSCTPAETPVLMSDWTFKPISDVRVGDVVVGFEFGDDGKKRHLTETVVTETNSRIAPTFEYTLESGRFVRCTQDHQWFNGRSPSDCENRRMYSPKDVGNIMCFVTDIDYQPTPEELNDYRYLAGIIDGEGACKHGSIYIHQSLEHNPEVWHEIRQVLARLKIPYTENGDSLWLTGGAEIKERIIRFGKPAKSFQILNTINTSAWVVREKEKIVSKKPLGSKRVYALTTETGNYIAWGYASKNCQYENKPVGKENALIKEEDILKWNYQTGDEREDGRRAKGHVLYLDKSAIDSYPHYVTIDLAHTDNKRSDSTAIVVNAVNPNSGTWYVRHYDTFKATDPNEIINRIFAINNEYPNILTWGIEKNNYGTWLQKPLEDAMRRKGVWLNIEALGHYGNQGNKALRLRSLAPRFGFRNCYIREDMVELEDQLLTLTYDGAKGHDDLLDAFAMQEEVANWGNQEEANRPDNEEELADKKDTFKDDEIRRYRSLIESEEESADAWMYV